jgi:hypothetical protein
MGRAEDLFERLKKQGVEAIRVLVLDRQSEELFLDFKRSSDNGCGTTLTARGKTRFSGQSHFVL